MSRRHLPKERQILGQMPRHLPAAADRSIVALRPDHAQHYTATGA
ncbi:hypothetical protein [Trueperella pyogenes]|nr:hypothetical protein [Trueperella pyogenes]